MPPRLPLALVELSILSSKRPSIAQLSRGLFARHLYQTSASENIIYPSSLSLTGNQQQPSVVPQPDRESLVFNEAISEFSESDLKAIYKDLLHLDAPPVKSSFKQTIQDPAVVLPRISRRIGDSNVSQTTKILDSLSQRLKSRLSPTISEPVGLHISNGKPYSDLLNALQRGNVRPELPVLGDSSTAPVMSESEWVSLIHACIQHLDFEGAFTSIRMMKRSGAIVSKDLCKHVLTSMAQEGLFREIQSFAGEFMAEYEDLSHFSFLITALCNCRFYSSAIQLLHAYEMQGKIPPMDAYRAVIRSLLRSPAPGNLPRRARAWDLFYHMRYVAHPTPSAELYTQMIGACADGPEVDTMRAFDLFTEMTVDKRIPPTVAAYNAIIRVAAKKKDTALEAIRLAKQMVDLGRDADGNPSLPMDYDTYLALLEACKRLGDIEQVRWVLTKLAQYGPEGSSVIDHWVLRHVFHTYATYTPPFKREFANLSHTIRSPGNPNNKSGSSREPSRAADGVTTLRTISSSNDPILPQTSQAVLSEVDNLFATLLAEKSQTQELATLSSPVLFSNVTRLDLVAQAYISVYFHHCERPTRAISKAQEIYDGLNLEWDPETIRMCMFNCAHGTKGKPPPEITQFAKTLWERFSTTLGGTERPTKAAWVPYAPTTPAERRLIPTAKLKASTIVNIWAAYIHVCVRNGDIDSALRIVGEFVKSYPPEEARINLCADLPLDSKISLEGSRTLVRMSQRALIDDDTVPPILVFTDVSSLHKALVRAERTADINHLTYILHAYAGSVRDRRGMNLLVDDVKDGWQGRRHSEEATMEKKKFIRAFEKRSRSGRLKAVLPRK